MAGLEDTDHQEKTRLLTWAGRDYLQNAFTERKMEFVPTFANFIMVKVGHGTSLFQAMLKKGVIIRDMTSYNLPAWIRVSIGTQSENEKFVQVLDECLGH